MLEITVIMDSPMQDVFAVKCCNFKLLDQNFEVLVRNAGTAPVKVRSHIDLETGTGTKRISNLMPQGDQTVAPGDSVGFYCYLEEAVYEGTRAVVMYDTDGKHYRKKL